MKKFIGLLFLVLLIIILIFFFNYKKNGNIDYSAEVTKMTNTGIIVNSKTDFGLGGDLNNLKTETGVLRE